MPALTLISHRCSNTPATFGRGSKFSDSGSPTFSDNWHRKGKHMIVPKVDIQKKASRVGVLDPNRRMDFTVVLANKVPLPAIHPARSKNPIKKHLTHDELWHRYGASVES